jgi:hypothetical protein
MNMARLLTGTILHMWRAFGRVRFTVRWDTGETMTITIPKRQIDAALHAGDSVGTIEPDPPYDADDLIRATEIQAMPPGEERYRAEIALSQRIEHRRKSLGYLADDVPWNQRQYQRA